MALDEPESDDVVEQINDIQVAIDPLIKEQTNGITLDYEEVKGERGLVMKGIHDRC